MVDSDGGLASCQIITWTSDDLVSESPVHFPGYDELNPLSMWQNGGGFADDIFKCILLNENVSFKLVPKCSTGINSTWVQVVASNRWQAIIWTNADSVYWCIYAALGGDEL